jgi:hypothetical protein
MNSELEVNREWRYPIGDAYSPKSVMYGGKSAGSKFSLRNRSSFNGSTGSQKSATNI